MRNVSDKIVEKTKTHNLCSVTSPLPKILPLMSQSGKIWTAREATDNMGSHTGHRQYGQTDRPQTIWTDRQATDRMDRQTGHRQYGQPDRPHTIWTATQATDNMDSQTGHRQYGQPHRPQTGWTGRQATDNTDSQTGHRQYGQPDRPQTIRTVTQATDNIIRCMRFACWILKATDTHSECFTLCFPKPTIVTRTRLNVTLHVRCSSC